MCVQSFSTYYTLNSWCDTENWWFDFTGICSCCSENTERENSIYKSILNDALKGFSQKESSWLGSISVLSEQRGVGLWEFLTQMKYLEPSCVKAFQIRNAVWKCSGLSANTFSLGHLLFSRRTRMHKIKMQFLSWERTKSVSKKMIWCADIVINHRTEPHGGRYFGFRKQ